MDLEKKNKKNEKIWEKAGFVAMYFIFTTLLYFILSFLNFSLFILQEKV